MWLLCRRHNQYGEKIVDITYDDRPKLLYYTIIIGGQNMVENGKIWSRTDKNNLSLVAAP